MPGYPPSHGIESIRFADRSIAKGSMFAPQIEVGNDSRMQGVLLAPKLLTLHDRVKLTGDAHWNESYQYGNGIQISGASIQDAVPSNCMVPIVPTSAGSEPIEVPNNDILGLAPGSYGTVMVRAHSILSLDAGRYSFASLDVEPDAKVEWETGTNDSLLIRVTGSVRIGDRTEMRGDGYMQILSGQNIDVGTDSWVKVDFLAPSGSIRIASRTQLGGRLLAKNVLFEPDVVAYVSAAISPTEYDSVLTTVRDTFSWSDYRQIAFRLADPEAERNGALSEVDREMLLRIYGQNVDSGRIVPLMSMVQSYGLQGPGSLQNREIALSVLAASSFPDSTKLGIYAPLELQVSADPVRSWDLTIKGNSVHVVPDSLQWMPALPLGSAVAQIKANLTSGRVVPNYFTFTVTPSELSEEVSQ